MGLHFGVQTGFAATVRRIAELEGRVVAYTSKTQPNCYAKRYKWQATGKESFRFRQILNKYANQYLSQPNFFLYLSPVYFFMSCVSFLFTVLYAIVSNRCFLAANLQNKNHIFICIYYYFTCIYNGASSVFENLCAKLLPIFRISYCQQIIYLAGWFCGEFANHLKIK